MPPGEHTYYAQIDGTQQGPYTASELLARRAEGNLPFNCYVWREGMAEWKPISVVLPVGMPRPISGTMPAPARGKHSGLGIASFASGLASGVIVFALLVVSGISEAAPGGMSDGAANVIGLFVIALFGICAGSIIAGIVDLIRQTSSKILPIIGLSSAGLAGFIMLLVMLIGLTME